MKQGQGLRPIGVRIRPCGRKNVPSHGPSHVMAGLDPAIPTGTGLAERSVSALPVQVGMRGSSPRMTVCSAGVAYPNAYGASPRTPPEGAALWTPAKGIALGTLSLVWGAGGGPAPQTKTDGVQRLRLWWGSRGQSPLAGFRAEPCPYPAAATAWPLDSRQMRSSRSMPIDRKS